MWALGDVVASRCPKSEISADSMAWLELFATWRAAGKGTWSEMSARDADALAILELELEKLRHEQLRK